MSRLFGWGFMLFFTALPKTYLHNSICRNYHILICNKVKFDTIISSYRPYSRWASNQLPLFSDSLASCVIKATQEWHRSYYVMVSLVWTSLYQILIINYLSRVSINTLPHGTWNQERWAEVWECYSGSLCSAL